MNAINTKLLTPIRSAWSLPALITLALLGLQLSGCGRAVAEHAAGGPPPADVDVATVVAKNVHPWDDFTGRIAAVETVDLRPRVSGYIEKVAFSEGQDVRRGDLLFVIDQRPYQAQLAWAQAQLERARSDATLAETQKTRADSLIEAKAISREDYEARTAGNSAAIAAVRAAEASLTTARLNLQYTEVRAPISGRASRAMVTVGNLAQADVTTLTTVVSQEPMYVYFDSDEATYLRYQRNTQATGNSGGNPVRVGLADETGYPHSGTLDFVDNQVDPGTGTIRARAVLPNTDHRLTPGLFARVQLQASTASSALLIDDKAVLTDQDRKYVYVLSPEQTAQRRDVTLGRMVDGLRVVEKGLTENDIVVVDGVQRIFFPGMPLKATVVAMGGKEAPKAVASN